MPVLSGRVELLGAGVARIVRVYNHADGELLAATVSDQSGAFSVDLPPGIEVDVLAIGDPGRAHIAEGPVLIE